MCVCVCVCVCVSACLYVCCALGETVKVVANRIGSTHTYTRACVCGLDSLFNGLSTLVGYLMPKLFS